MKSSTGLDTSIPERLGAATGLPSTASKAPSAKVATMRATGKLRSAEVPTLARNRKTPGRKAPELRAQPQNPCTQGSEPRHGEVRGTTREGLRVARNGFTVACNDFPVAHGGRKVRGARVLPLRPDVFRLAARASRLRTRLLSSRACAFLTESGSGSRACGLGGLRRCTTRACGVGSLALPASPWLPIIDFRQEAIGRQSVTTKCTKFMVHRPYLSS